MQFLQLYVFGYNSVLDFAVCLFHTFTVFCHSCYPVYLFMFVIKRHFTHFFPLAFDISTADIFSNVQQPASNM